MRRYIKSDQSDIGCAVEQGARRLLPKLCSIPLPCRKPSNDCYSSQGDVSDTGAQPLSRCSIPEGQLHPVQRVRALRLCRGHLFELLSLGIETCLLGSFAGGYEIELQ